ncbi:hypothetical protein LR48_Vigan10g112600 [Vigna angularis]|uniref:Cation-transporting P-type ATPase C-terminal domain-containing protein n=1 Tax=Phaseolus angularis TaxID=3914 RepID=A0A0L9VKH3_PHAAN|nr:hypothetical protein LR48_Vigan10g112600 [Vigna angularis]
MHNRSSKWPPDVCTMHTSPVLPQQAQPCHSLSHSTKMSKTSKKFRNDSGSSSFKGLSIKALKWKRRALALPTEEPTDDLMKMPPVEFRGTSIFDVIEKVKNTIIFNSFVLYQVFNEFNARELEKKNIFKGLGKNRLFIVIVSLIVVLQLVMVEFLKEFANIERLTWEQWRVCSTTATEAHISPSNEVPRLSSFKFRAHRREVARTPSSHRDTNLVTPRHPPRQQTPSNSPLRTMNFVNHHPPYQHYPNVDTSIAAKKGLTLSSERQRKEGSEVREENLGESLCGNKN